MKTLWSLLVIAAVGCGAAEPAATPPPAKADSEPVALKMHDHFIRLVAVQQAVIRGDIESAKREAAELGAGLRNAAHPKGWGPHLHPVRKQVFATARATSIEDAAASTASTAAACGSCHTHLGIEVRTNNGAQIAAGESGMSAVMQRHLVAADNLWNGIIGPSEAAWQEGARDMAAAGALPSAGEMSPQMQASAERLQQLAQSAALAKSPDARTQLYGELLGTCAECHRSYLNSVD